MAESSKYSAARAVGECARHDLTVSDTAAMLVSLPGVVIPGALRSVDSTPLQKITGWLIVMLAGMKTQTDVLTAIGFAPGS